MVDYAIKDELEGALKEQTEEIINVMQTFVQQMDEGFTKIENRLSSLDQKCDHLINTIDSIIAY